MSQIDVAEGPTGSLVDRAVHYIRAFIKDQDLKVGDRLPGAGHFATQLGVSNAVMREAYGALAALRLIDVANGRAARVGAIDGVVMSASLDHAIATAQVSMMQIWDVRRTLEFRTVELAATNRTVEDAKAIVTEAEAMFRTRDDLDGMIRHDVRLHQAIARAGANQLFYQIIRSFEPLMLLAVPAAWQTRRTARERKRILDCHRDLARAIAASDVTAAKAALTVHFSGNEDGLLD